jgi:outer membrane immunogenic protein
MTRIALRFHILFSQFFSFSFLIAAFIGTFFFSPSFAASSETPNWTGVYVGGHIGGGFSKINWYEDATQGGSGLPTGTSDGVVHANGVLGGVQAGYNYQIERVVLGIQADISVADISGTDTCFPTFAGQSCGTRIDSLGTLTARIGTTYHQALFYALGGGAWEKETLSNSAPNGGPGGAPINLSFVGTRAGWTVGAGVEYAFVEKWSAFLQYNFISFGTQDLTFTSSNVPSFSENISENLNVVKLGVNYRF